MTIMKNLFIMLFLVFASICNAQENESVRKALEERYGAGTVEYKADDGGWYKIKRDGMYGACDLQGKEVVPLGDYSISKDHTDYGDFYCVSQLKDRICKEGIFNQKGDRIIPMIERIDNFSFEKYVIVAVKQGEISPYDVRYMTLGIYNKKGKLLLPCEYTFIQSYNEEKGIYLIGKGGYSGTPLGYWIYPIDAKYALYDALKENFMTDFIYGYIDFLGVNKVDRLSAFNVGGKIINNLDDYDVVVEGGKWGYMDKEGKEVIPAKYTNVTPFKDGIAQVTENGVTSLIQNPLSGGSVLIRTGESVAVDTQIPETEKSNNETFAFILSNENYSNFSGSDYAINDGKIFAEYCKKTLGMPENNIRYYEDATYGNMLKAIKQIKDIADVYDGDAKIIFYFSGLGISDEKDGGKYILPSDASVTSLASTALSLNELLAELNELKTVYTLAFIDAPFNGMDKNGKPLLSGRGVRISSRNNENLVGNTILVTGNDSGNSYSSKKQGHGLLTYSLLNQLKQTQGTCCIQKLLETISTDVKKESLEQFKDVQKPWIKVSEQIKNNIQTLKL